ncbi:MAG: GntR family transcriptional regulator [Acidimicrobiales bacterium]
MYTASYTGTSRAEQTYGELKRLLLNGEFALGHRLGEERLAGLIGVSRTPVREALCRLHVEGFVERLPEGGFCPSAPDLDRIRQLYEVRIGLERLALRRAAVTGEDHDGEQLQRLRDDWVALLDPPYDTDPSFVLLDEDFHVRLATASGNAALAEQLQVVNERIRIVRVHDFLSPERVERTVEQHIGIVEALIPGDVDETERRLDTHFGESLAVVEERAATALVRMMSASRTLSNQATSNQATSNQVTSNQGSTP